MSLLYNPRVYIIFLVTVKRCGGTFVVIDKVDSLYFGRHGEDQ